jgi:Rab11 family-interacting protein 3/4
MIHFSPLYFSCIFSHLYRSSSFNSSGRSSNCDTTEDMYSDVSLEDVQDLSHKLEVLQRQITNLTDTHMNTEDRNIRAKTDYAVLQTKYQMLEDQLRETEIRCEERILEEQKRCRELLTRVERESELKNENCQIRIQTMEGEVSSLRDEIHRLRTQCDKQAIELSASEEKLESTRFNLSIAQENLMEARALEKRHLTEKNQSDQMIMELHKEVDRIRSEAQGFMNSVKKSNGFNQNYSASSLSLESNVSSEPFRMEELLNELEDVKNHNKQLQETNEELQAMLLNKNIEEGRNLLNGGTSNLADELKEMDHNQVNYYN